MGVGPPMVSAWLYAAVWAGVLADQFLGAAWCGIAAGQAMLAFLLLELPRQRRFALVLFLGLMAIGLAGVARADDPLGLYLAGWRRGAVYGAFYLALSSLRDAAETSPLVRRCGHHLAGRPAGQRYLALTGGGHLFGIILSYGAIDLLGAMVAGANSGSPGAKAGAGAARMRRMIVAIQRGFCVMNCWSPLNLMTAIVTTAIPAAPMRALLPVAFLAALGMTAIGWLDDRIGGGRANTGLESVSNDTWWVHARIVALVALVLVLSEAASLVLRVTLVGAVTLFVPLVALCWAVAQTWGREKNLWAAVRRRGEGFGRRLPGFRGEAATLACSGFMGIGAAGLVPAEAMGALLAHVPPLAVPLLVPVLLILTGQIGLNPVAVVALLGAALPDPARLGISPAVLALACMLGWAVGVSLTPMSASAMIAARWAGVSPWTVGSVWNARFGLGCLVLTWIVLSIAAVLGV